MAGNRYIIGTINNYVAALDVTNGSEVWTQTTVPLNPGVSPAVKNGQVYAIGNASTDQMYLYSFNTATGSSNWSSPASVGNPPTRQVRFPTQPTIDNNKIYLAHQTQYQASSTVRHVSLSAFTITTGSRAWGLDLTNSSTTACFPSSPVVLGGNLAFLGLSCNGSKIAAVNLSTQSLAWLISGVLPDTFDNETIASLAYTTDPAELLVTGATKMWALNPATGQKIWDWQPSTGQPLLTNATVVGNTIWVASGSTGNWRWHALSNLSRAEIGNWQAPPGNGGLPNQYPALSGNLFLFSVGVTTASPPSQRWALQVSSTTLPATAWFDQALLLQ